MLGLLWLGFRWWWLGCSWVFGGGGSSVVGLAGVGLGLRLILLGLGLRLTTEQLIRRGGWSPE